MDFFQSAKLENETFPNPYYLYFPITSTIAYMLVSVFDWVFLGYSEIGFSLWSSIGPPAIVPSLEYSVIGSSLESLMIGSS